MKLIVSVLLLFAALLSADSVKVIPLSDVDAKKVAAVFSAASDAKASFARLYGEVQTRAKASFRPDPVTYRWSSGLDFSFTEDFRYLLERRNGDVISVDAADAALLRISQSEAGTADLVKAALVRDIESRYMQSKRTREECRLMYSFEENVVKCLERTVWRNGWENYRFSPDYKFLVVVGE